MFVLYNIISELSEGGEQIPLLLLPRIRPIDSEHSSDTLWDDVILFYNYFKVNPMPV